MGRHSAPSRVKPRLERTAANSLAVLLFTIAVTAVIFAGITTIAVVKNSEIPPPDVATISPDGNFGVQPSDGISEPSAAETLRRCPATGCTASTCHAETGEPPPWH
jgi:hypothetical protein